MTRLASAVCRYDLDSGPIKLTVPISRPIPRLSFYTRRGVAYYAINDRSAGRRQIELQLMTAAQTRRSAGGRRRHRRRPADCGIAKRHRAHRDAGACARTGADAGRPGGA